MAIDVDQRPNHESLRVRIDQRQQGMGAPEAIPDAVEGVKVWFIALPQRILSFMRYQYGEFPMVLE